MNPAMQNSESFIIPSTIRSDQVTVTDIGGKAWNLLKLHEAGFAVPQWWAVSTNLYDSVISSHYQMINDLLDQTAFTNNEDVERTATRIRDVFLKVDIPEEFCHELDKTMGKTGGVGMYAVRSSVRDEDSAGHSFAGLMESFLNQRPEDLPDCIRRVWISAYSARALSYRRQKAISIRNISAAVVIQEMIMAKAAGVLFTRDPGNRQKTCIISAAYGLGEGVTSDLSDTDTYRFEWNSGSISRQVSRKKHLVIARCEGGTNIKELEPMAQESAVLSNDQIRELGELAVRAEAIFQTPLDIEWAFDSEGKCWVLQARPIVFTESVHWAQIWDNANIVESYPGLTLPLTFSFACELYGRTFRELALTTFKSGRLRWERHPVFRELFGLIDGRVYLNLLNWYQMLSLLPGFQNRKKAWDQMFGISKEITPPRTHLSLIESTCVLAVVVKTLLTVQLTRHRFDEWFYQLYGKFMSLKLEEMNENKLVETYQQFISRITERWYFILRNDFCAMTYYDWLEKLCRHWVPDDHHNLHNDLLRGQTNIESIAPSRSIDHLAHLFKEREDYRALISMADNAKIWKKIHSEENFTMLKHALHKHVNDFGDRSAEELKLEIPSFREKPERVLGLIKNRIHITTTIDEIEDQSMHARLLSELVMRQKIGNPIKRAVLHFVLANARRSLANRESMRLARGRVYGIVRRIFNRIGMLFEEKDLIDSRRDIFYLTVGEISDFIHGSAVTQDLRAIIEIRRAEYVSFKSHEPPSRFQTFGLAYQSVPSVAAMETNDTNTAVGIGCSSGKATGIARIIRDPGKANVKAGEIIVACSTDPAWVYLMTVCKGIVVERGSVLSHTAIIGRELGIPTIVGVPEATKRIPNKATITINGQTGHVQW